MWHLNWQAVDNGWVRMSWYVFTCSNTIESNSQNWAFFGAIRLELWTDIAGWETWRKVETIIEGHIGGFRQHHTWAWAAVGGTLHEVETALWSLLPVWTANSLKSGSWLFCCGWVPLVGLPLHPCLTRGQKLTEGLHRNIDSLSLEEEGGYAYILDWATLVGIINRTAGLAACAASRLVWTGCVVFPTAVRIQQVLWRWR